MRKFEIEEVVRYELEVDDEDLEGVDEDGLERVVDEIFCNYDSSQLPVTVEARHVTEITVNRRNHESEHRFLARNECEAHMREVHQVKHGPLALDEAKLDAFRHGLDLSGLSDEEACWFVWHERSHRDDDEVVEVTARTLYDGDDES